MAGAHSAITTLLATSTITTSSRTTAESKEPLAVSTSTCALSPSKLTKRRNSLRLKLLKTLRKPYPNTTITPILPDESLSNFTLPMESDESHSGNDVGLPSEEEFHPSVIGEDEKNVEVSESSGSVGFAGVSELSTRSVLKFGLYLVGIFVFQTICAVWVMGSASSDQEHDNSVRKTKRRYSLNGNGNGNLFNGKLALKPDGFLYVDEAEIEGKILEIRAMAREAREIEKKEGKDNNLASDFDDVIDSEDTNGSVNSRARSGIEMEVDSRLLKLKKRLNFAPEKSLGSLVSYLSKSLKVEDRNKNGSPDSDQFNGGLMFKKKQKFRSQSTKLWDDPKGFKGHDDPMVSNKKKTSSDATSAVMRSGSIGRNDAKLLSKESKSQKLKKERGTMGVANTETTIGFVQEKPTDRANKSRESSAMETRNSSNFTNENQDDAAVRGEHAPLSRNFSSERKKAGSKPVTDKAMNKKSESMNDSWWLKLPYVLVILLRGGSDPEGPGGLYTLKSTSQTADQSGLSYIVAFEDRGDANNFCYLLESFFEALGDCSADIVPLSIKDLQEELQSLSMKPIVVKKGQLQLYAGQPLADAETCLRALAERN